LYARSFVGHFVLSICASNEVDSLLLSIFSQSLRQERNSLRQYLVQISVYFLFGEKKYDKRKSTYEKYS